MGDAMGDYGMYDTRRRVDRPGLSSERRHIEREMAKLRARVAELDAAADRFGEEPPVGTVITFEKQFPNSIKTYSYAAIRTGPERVAGAGWFLTGRDASQPRTWAWLTDFIGDGPFRVIAPESGKSKFFNVMLGDHTFSNMVLAVDEAGKTTLGVDPARPKMTDLARAARKLGLFTVAPEEVKRPLERVANPVAPFYAIETGDRLSWAVCDSRVAEQPAVVVAFPADHDGERRARQSAADRNRVVWHSYRAGLEEPPVGARVRSKSNPRLWAVREDNGWTRYNGSVMQCARLRWETARRQLGGTVEPFPAT
jgi:hypothetical protein